MTQSFQLVQACVSQQLRSAPAEFCTSWPEARRKQCITWLCSPAGLRQNDAYLATIRIIQCFIAGQLSKMYIASKLCKPDKGKIQNRSLKSSIKYFLRILIKREVSGQSAVSAVCWCSRAWLESLDCSLQACSLLSLVWPWWGMQGKYWSQQELSESYENCSSDLPLQFEASPPVQINKIWAGAGEERICFSTLDLPWSG